MTTIDTSDLEQLKKLVEQFPALALRAAEPAMTQALLYLHGRIPEYPPKPAPGASKFWTDKQRRWFWWQIGQGNTALFEYVRTGTLGRRITERVTTDQGGVTGEVGMNTPYAPVVVGRADQAAIHKGRWWVFEDVIEQHIDGAFQEFNDTFYSLFLQEWNRDAGLPG